MCCGIKFPWVPVGLRIHLFKLRHKTNSLIRILKRPMLISSFLIQLQDAQLASVAQLLDVVSDLEKAHDAYAKIEHEKMHGLHCNHTDIIRDSGMWEREEEEEQHLGVGFYCGDDWRTSGRSTDENGQTIEDISQNRADEDCVGDLKISISKSDDRDVDSLDLGLISKPWEKATGNKNAPQSEMDNYVTMYVSSQSNIKEDSKLDHQEAGRSSAPMTFRRRPRSKEDNT